MTRYLARLGVLRAQGRAGRVIRVLWRTIGSLLAHDGVELAGHLAFTALLALFPFLVFLAALASLIGGQDIIRTLLEFLFRFAPTDVAQTLSAPIVDVLGHQQRGFLTLGFVFAIWAASNGVDALRLTLNRAYRFAEHRSVVRQKLLSILAVLIGGSFIFVAAVFIVVGPFLWELLRWIFPLSMDDERLWTLSCYGLEILLATGITAVLHRLLPAQPPRWREILPGAIVTSLLLLVLAGIFAHYLTGIGSYGSTYGALAGVLMTLLFFDLTALIFIFGAELNTSLVRAAERRPRQYRNERVAGNRPGSAEPGQSGG
jgi:membrane protein